VILFYSVCCISESSRWGIVL